MIDDARMAEAVKAAGRNVKGWDIRIEWEKIGNCPLEKDDHAVTFCICGCRPYCPCHQLLPDMRDGFCGRGRHPYWDIPTKQFVVFWHITHPSPVTEVAKRLRLWETVKIEQ